MNLARIRSDAHTRYCNARKVEYLIQSDDFELAYTAADPDQRDQLIRCVGMDYLGGIKVCIQEVLIGLTPFHRMGIRRLRSIGKQMRVKNYFAMNKQTLVQEIQDEVDRIKKSSERVTNQSETSRPNEDSC